MPENATFFAVGSANSLLYILTNYHINPGLKSSNPEESPGGWDSVGQPGMRSDKPRFRGGNSYGRKNRDGFIRCSWRKAGGLLEHVPDGRPVIGNSHLRDIAEYVRRGVREAGEARAFAKANEKSYA